MCESCPNPTERPYNCRHDNPSGGQGQEHDTSKRGKAKHAMRRNQIVKRVVAHIWRHRLSGLGDDAGEKELWRAPKQLDSDDCENDAHPDDRENDPQTNPTIEFHSHDVRTRADMYANARFVREHPPYRKVLSRALSDVVKFDLNY